MFNFHKQLCSYIHGYWSSTWVSIQVFLVFKALSLQVIQWHKTLINITGLFILLLFAIYYLFVKFDSI